MIPSNILIIIDRFSIKGEYKIEGLNIFFFNLPQFYCSTRLARVFIQCAGKIHIYSHYRSFHIFWSGPTSLRCLKTHLNATLLGLSVFSETEITAQQIFVS
jgi:hypothetical protein